MTRKTGCSPRRSEANPATILDKRHADKAAWPAGNQVRAAGLVARGRCLYCLPSSCIAALSGTTRRPLTEPASDHPRPVLWRGRPADSGLCARRHQLRPGDVKAPASRRLTLEADAAKVQARTCGQPVPSLSALPPWCHDT